MLPTNSSFWRPVASSLAWRWKISLVEEILRSHRQWSNTFESIQDLVLLHDADFHILKANPALLEKLEKSHSEVVGELCEAILPKGTMQWTKCPYCRGE